MPHKQQAGLIFFLLVTEILFLAIGCSGAMTQQFILPADWLESHLTSPSITVVDVRSPEKYAQGHILQAVNLSVNLTFDPGPRNDLLAPISVITKLFSSTGIRQDSHLVLYGADDFLSPARMFWILEVFGHTNVSILDISYQMWKNEKRPTSSEPVILPKSVFTPSIQATRAATSFSILLAIKDKSTTILDARAKEQYEGKVSIAKRYGHIPTALSRPWYNNLQSNQKSGRLKPLGDLSTLYNTLDKNKKIITYCNKGKESALVYFILRTLGYNVAAYDGSWFEWGNDSTLPIE